MYRPQRNRPTPSSSSARLAAEAAFSAPPPERPSGVAEAISHALIIVKKKRLVDGMARDPARPETHDDAERAPRIFRVQTALAAVHDDGEVRASPDVASEPRTPTLAPDSPHQPSPRRRARRPAIARPGPVITTVAAPSHESVDLAALARELEASMTAREHAAEQAQLGRLQAQLSALDSVLAVIAKARDFTLADVQMSLQWQQLMQAAHRLADGMAQGQVAPLRVMFQ